MEPRHHGAGGQATTVADKSMTSSARIRLWILALMTGACVLACAPKPEARLAEIRASHEEGRFAETLESISELFARYPDDPAVMRVYAVTMLELDNAGLAIWPLRRLVEQGVADIEDQLLLARALRLGGARREAFAALAEVLAAEPDRRQALAMQSELALELDEFEILLANAERLIQLAPRRWPMAFLWRARGLAGLERYAEAYAALEDGSEVYGAPRGAAAALKPRLCRAGVEIAEKAGNPMDVEARWDGCLRGFPNDPELVARGVDFFDARGERARATGVLERAVEAAPQYLPFRTHLADRLAAERRFEEALGVLMQATELERISEQAWIAVADFHRERDDFEAAMTAMEHALVGREATHEFVLAQYAEDCIQAGQLEKAERMIANLRRPEYVALLRGRIHLARGENEQALDALHEGLRFYQGNAAARYLAGRAAERLGDVDLAIREYRDAIRAGPSDSDAVFALARFYEAEGNIGGMHHVLQLRLRRDSGDAAAMAELARLRTLYGEDAAAARAAIEELAALPGQGTAAAVATARLEDRFSGPSAAAAALESSELDLTRPIHVDALRMYVRYLARADRAAEALSRTAAALEAHPDSAQLHEVHANALHAAGRPRDEIERALTHALEIDPRSTAALAGLARLASESGGVDEAIALYDRAAAADPEETSPAWNAIELLLASGREEAIDRRVEELLSRDPIHTGALNLRVRRLLAEGGDLAVAASLARRAVRFGGGPEALITFGLVAIERDEFTRALRSLQRAAQVRSLSPETEYALARAFEAAGDSGGAIAALRRALAGDEFPDANAARARLARLLEEAQGEQRMTDDDGGDT